MARLRQLRRLRRLTGLPWSVLLEGALITRGHWRSLSPRDRRRLAALARKSGGWPGRLSAPERAQARELLGRLDMSALGRELVGLARSGPRGRAAWARSAAHVVRLARASEASARRARSLWRSRGSRGGERAGQRS
jgi:hypothetical protein